MSFLRGHCGPLVYAAVAILCLQYVGCTSGSRDHDATARTKLTIKSYSEVFELVKRDIGRYPSSVNAFDLIYKRNGEKGWNGPYLGRRLDPLDSWNRRLVYRYPAKCTDRVVPEIYSLGKNGLDECGAGDDVGY